MLYLVEDNGYAISTPIEVQTPGGDLSRVVASFPGLQIYRVDGTDYLAAASQSSGIDAIRSRSALSSRLSSTPSGPVRSGTGTRNSVGTIGAGCAAHRR